MTATVAVLSEYSSLRQPLCNTTWPETWPLGTDAIKALMSSTSPCRCLACCDCNCTRQQPQAGLRWLAQSYRATCRLRRIGKGASTTDLEHLFALADAVLLLADEAHRLLAHLLLPLLAHPLLLFADLALFFQLPLQLLFLLAPLLLRKLGLFRRAPCSPPLSSAPSALGMPHLHCARRMTAHETQSAPDTRAWLARSDLFWRRPWPRRP